MKTILITGPIGSGKSALSRILESRGFPVYNSDSRTKALYESVPGLKDRIESILGIPFGELSSVFSSPSLLARLEALVYPYVLADFENWKDSCKGDIAFMESAVAADKAILKGVFDEIWLVDAPLDVRVSRNPKAAQRNHLQDFSSLRADKIFINDSTLDNLEKQLNI